MKFPYRKIGDYWMPVIHVGLQRESVRIFVEALVDSGSSCCIFTADLAPVLGIVDVRGGRRVGFSGISGVELAGFRHSIDLVIGGKIFRNIDVLFSEELPVNSINILGQHGFFELFPVKFLQSRGEIDILLRSKYAKRR